VPKTATIIGRLEEVNCYKLGHGIGILKQTILSKSTSKNISNTCYINEICYIEYNNNFTMLDSSKPTKYTCIACR